MSPSSQATVATRLSSATCIHSTSIVGDGARASRKLRATADMLRTSYWPRQQPHSTQRRALWRPSTCRCASLSLSREPRCMQGRRKRVGNEICTFLRTKVHSTFCNCRNPAVNTKVRMKRPMEIKLCFTRAQGRARGHEPPRETERGYLCSTVSLGIDHREGTPRL